MKAQRVSKGKSAILHISIENLREDAIDITGMMAFLGVGRSPVVFTVPGEPEFDALVDIEKKAALELRADSHGALKYPDQQLTLGPHHLLAFDLDIAKLKWEQMSSSSYWPASFSTTVPAGNYSEYLSVTVRDSMGKFEVKSNGITLEVLP